MASKDSNQRQQRRESEDGSLMAGESTHDGASVKNSN